MKLFHKLNGKWSEVTSSDGGNSNINLPEDGIDGQILSKDSSSESGLKWVNQNKTEYPDNGVNGQILIHDNTTEIGAKWGLVQAPHNLSVGDMGYTYSDNPPSNALFCGGLVSKTQYPELYKVIGDKFTYGGLTYKDKLMVPEWVEADRSKVITDITSDLTLGDESYYSAILNGNIKITSIGQYGGIYPNYSYNYYAWNMFNTDVFSSSTPGGLYHTNIVSSPTNFTVEIEFLDGDKFAPYVYGMKQRSITGYFASSWILYGYDSSSSSWEELHSVTGGSDTNPSSSELTLYTIGSYNNTKTYNKFRLVFTTSTAVMMDWLRIYGTKEGEDSIYDLFALPPSVEDTTGAKNYIVATSGSPNKDCTYTEEERVIGTWVDGKPVYRLSFEVTTGASVNTSNSIYDLTAYNINKVINLYGTYLLTSGGNYPINCNSANVEIMTWVTSVKNLGEYHTAEHTSNVPGRVTIEYTKTTD